MIRKKANTFAKRTLVAGLAFIICSTIATNFGKIETHAAQREYNIWFLMNRPPGFDYVPQEFGNNHNVKPKKVENVAAKPNTKPQVMVEHKLQAVAEQYVVIEPNETKPIPNQFDTRSATTFTNRRLTNCELATWIAEYHKLGGMNYFEFEIVRIINETRTEHGLRPLYISPELSIAARFHSQEMYDLNYFAHHSPVYGRPSARARMFGHKNTDGTYWVRETLRRGVAHGTPENQVYKWMNSPPHRAVLLDERLVSIGVGRVGGLTAVKFGT